MKKRMAKLIATLMVSVIMTTAGGVTAFAYVDPAAETQTEAEPTATETEAVLPEETEEAPNTDGSAWRLVPVRRISSRWVDRSRRSTKVMTCLFDNRLNKIA